MEFDTITKNPDKELKWKEALKKIKEEHGLDQRTHKITAGIISNQKMPKKEGPFSPLKINIPENLKLQQEQNQQLQALQ